MDAIAQTDSEIGGLVEGEVGGLFDVFKTIFFNPLTVKVKFVYITHLKKSSCTSKIIKLLKI